MERAIKGIIIGIGNMGSVAARCMLDHGVEIVGTVDINPELQGRKVTEICGSNKPCNTIVTGDLDELLASVEADIAIVATETAVADIREICEKCIRKGINVGTTSEESYFPWQTAAEEAKALDELAKEYGVTIYASGIQDVFYNNLSFVLAGACNDIKAIHCYNFLPLEDMGQVVADEMFLGRDVAEYDKSLEETGGVNPLAEDTLTTAYGVSASLGLNVISDYMDCKPIVGEKPMYYRGLDITLPADKMIGIDSVAGVKTEEGIDIEIVFRYKISDEGETPLIEWTIEGDPDLKLVVENIKGEVTTSSSLVNRIPDIMNAEAGFKTFLDMDKPAYRSKPMNEYVK